MSRVVQQRSNKNKIKKGMEGGGCGLNYHPCLIWFWESRTVKLLTVIESNLWQNMTLVFACCWVFFGVVGFFVSKEWVNNCWWGWQNRTDLGKCTHLYGKTQGKIKHKRFWHKVFVRCKEIDQIKLFLSIYLLDKIKLSLFIYLLTPDEDFLSKALVFRRIGEYNF